jgi:hypothetical protein
MAGHSQFKNIMHRKGRQDKARSKLFSKLAKEITVAAKMGMPDPDMNPRLRLAVQNAKSQSMPKDNIERAIKKSQAGEGDDYEEIRYEGYGPGGIAVVVEAMTDNRNRTASAVRSYFTKSMADRWVKPARYRSCSTGLARSSMRLRPATRTRSWRPPSTPAPKMSCPTKTGTRSIAPLKTSTRCRRR